MLFDLLQDLRAAIAFGAFCLLAMDFQAGIKRFGIYGLAYVVQQGGVRKMLGYWGVMVTGSAAVPPEPRGQEEQQQNNPKAVIQE